MSRIRTVKPEWMEDEGLLRAGSDARVLSVCLILLADDYGRGRYIPEVLAGQCFPFPGESRESSRVCREAFESLSAMGFVRVYEVRGQRYFEIVNWSRHQKVDKPGKPRVPEPLDDTRESSRESRETLAPDHDHDHDHERSAREGPVEVGWIRLGKIYQQLHDAEQEGARNPRPYDEQRITSTDSRPFRKLYELTKTEAARSGIGERQIFTSAARAFLRDEKQRAKGLVLEFFARDFATYVDRSLEAAS
jgi:hypothetical protein